MYLIDTNIFLELFLEQKRAKEVKNLFLKISPSKIWVSDFSVYSIGIILFKCKKFQIFYDWIEEIINSGIQIVRLNPEDMKIVGKNAKKYGLDFDDAYQYTIVQKYNLQIISFDKDFDNTDIGRKEPSEIII
jgi:predicted nucleic acid-binding protein